MELKIETESGMSRAAFHIEDLVIAGWAGRDKAAVEEHIVELEALGIARPPATPVFYRVAASRLTCAGSIQVWGDASSGEAEAVLFSDGEGNCFVGVGSDHTDRRVEAYDITVSKQMCDKPVARTAWPLEEVAGHWDSLILRSFIEEEGRRVLYQEGSVAQLLSIQELAGDYANGDALGPGTAMFGGTLAAIGGIRPSRRFEAQLEDPILGRSISFGYRIDELPR